MRPYPSKQWRITNERRMNQLGQQSRGQSARRSLPLSLVGRRIPLLDHCCAVLPRHFAQAQGADRGEQTPMIMERGARPDALPNPLAKPVTSEGFPMANEARQTSNMWWCVQSGRQGGPMSLDELKGKLRDVDT